jgi:hypothetical protein
MSDIMGRCCWWHQKIQTYHVMSEFGNFGDVVLCCIWIAKLADFLDHDSSLSLFKVFVESTTSTLTLIVHALSSWTLYIIHLINSYHVSTHTSAVLSWMLRYELLSLCPPSLSHHVSSLGIVNVIAVLSWMLRLHL